MIKKILLVIFLNILFVSLPNTIAAADLSPGSTCDPKNINSGLDRCLKGSSGLSYSCQQDKTIITATAYTCQIDVFGQVQPPQAIQDLGIGSIGISKFLNNLIVLIYILASVVFVFMLLWGAFQWITSGGNKENIDAARKRIMHAIIGIVLFAILFAVLQVMDIFTGFTFFIPKGVSQCDDIFYYDSNVNQCIHKYYTSTPCPTDLKLYVYERVDNRFCGR